MGSDKFNLAEAEERAGRPPGEISAWDLRHDNERSLALLRRFCEAWDEWTPDLDDVDATRGSWLDAIRAEIDLRSEIEVRADLRRRRGR
jgi:hypothetical protein